MTTTSLALSATLFLAVDLTAQVRVKRAAVRSAASSIAVGSPSMGLLAGNEASELRPVYGVSSHGGLGANLLLSGTAAFLAISPQHDYALSANASGAWSVLTFEAGAAREVAVFGSGLEKCKKAAISPTGQAITLWEPGRIHVFTGLPANPRLLYSRELPESGASIRALAVDDQGEFALAGFSDGASGSIHILSRRGATHSIEAGAPSAIRVLPGSPRAFATDAARNQIVELDLLTGGAQRIAGAEQGLKSPSDLALDTARKRLLVADSGAGAIVALTFTGAVLQSIPCGFAPSRITALRTQAAYAVGNAAGDNYWLLDAGPEQARISFLPKVDQ